MKLNCKLTGEALVKLQNGGRIVYDELRRGVEEAAALTDQIIVAESPKVTGSLMKSISKRVTDLTAEIYPTVPHANFVHFGTRPHGTPGAEMKPGGAIYRWAQKKGINPYAVAKSIAKKGTKANPFMNRALDKAERDVPKIFEDVTKRIVDKFT